MSIYHESTVNVACITIYFFKKYDGVMFLGATTANETYLNYATTKKHALWEQSGYFWPKAKF